MKITTEVLNSHFSNDGAYIADQIKLSDEDGQEVYIVFREETGLYAYSSYLHGDTDFVHSDNEFELRVALNHAYTNLGVIDD